GNLEFDEITKEYLDGRAKRPYTPVSSDPDAEYEKVFEFDAAAVELGVAKPMSPDNYAPLSEGAGTRLDQVFIGSCTNSRITDLRRAAAVLENHKVAPGGRLIITPSSHPVALPAEQEGLIRRSLGARHGSLETTSTPTRSSRPSTQSIHWTRKSSASTRWKACPGATRGRPASRKATSWSADPTSAAGRRGRSRQSRSAARASRW